MKKLLIILLSILFLSACESQSPTNKSLNCSPAAIEKIVHCGGWIHI